MLQNTIEVKDKVIHFRITEKEYDIVAKRQKQLGFNNMSQYLRYVVNKDLREE